MLARAQNYLCAEATRGGLFRAPHAREEHTYDKILGITSRLRNCRLCLHRAYQSTPSRPGVPRETLYDDFFSSEKEIKEGQLAGWNAPCGTSSRLRSCPIPACRLPLLRSSSNLILLRFPRSRSSRKLNYVVAEAYVMLAVTTSTRYYPSQCH